MLEELGSGGMSVVYRGLDTALNREVAVKVLHPHLAGKEDARRRLAREAEAVARLSHPNILEIFDFGAVDAEHSYLVTEYIRGETLKQYVDRNAFGLPEIAALIIHQIASALAAAHDADIIHRDLKPENIMVTHQGTVKLMDFGIAKMLDRDDRMTQTGALVGSPAYMAPEIIKGEPVGKEADVFALGAVFYYLVTRKLPFAASSTAATLKRIVDGEFEDPRSACAALSDRLSDFIHQCLHNNPQDRFPNAGAMRDALEAYFLTFELSHLDNEVESYFLDPPSYTSHLKAQVIKCLVASARGALSARKIAGALVALNQILSLDPLDSDALKLKENIQRGDVRKKFYRASFKGLAAAIALAGIVLLKREALNHVSTAPPAKIFSRKNTGGDPAIASHPLPVAKSDLRPSKPPVQHPFRTTPNTPLPMAAITATSSLPISVRIRPFGSLRIDGGSTRPEEQLHQLEMAPGNHRAEVSCQYCMPVVYDFTVRDNALNEFHWGAQPKPSRLRFRYLPEDATVQVDGKNFTAGQTIQNPVVLGESPGPSSFKRTIAYAVSRPGYQSAEGVISLVAGEERTLEGNLLKE